MDGLNQTFVKIILIQYQKRNRMRQGHRRTQSANLTSHGLQSTLEKHLIAQDKHHIIYLLDRCQTKVQQKVCTIDLLNSPIASQQGELFNFGKGLMKGSLQQRDKNKKYNQIISIPQKQTNVVKIKRTPHPQTHSKNKQRQLRQPIIEPRMSEADKKQMFFNESMNKIMKPKVGSIVDPKSKKYSFYETGLIKNVKSGKSRKET